MPRFVVLSHDHPEPHFDLMLEADGVLRTWRLASFPTTNAEAIPLPDHRIAYLDYEGPVSGHRGSVQRVDQGKYDGPLDRIRFQGDKLRGIACLEKVSDCLWRFRLTDS